MRPNNDSRNQVKLCVFVDWNDSAISFAPPQYQLALLDRILVRAALRSRAQLDNTNAQPFTVSICERCAEFCRVRFAQ